MHSAVIRVNTVCCGYSLVFVCVEVLRPSQPNGVMSSEVSLPNHTFTGQAQSSKRLTSIVHILSPETDNCPSWNQRKGENGGTHKMCLQEGHNMF